MSAPPIPMRSDEQFVEELRERMDAKRRAHAAVTWAETTDRLLERAARRLIAKIDARATERGPLRDCGDDTCTACAPKGAK